MQWTTSRNSNMRQGVSKSNILKYTWRKTKQHEEPVATCSI